MLEFMKDGKKVSCGNGMGLYGNVRPGQVVVLTHVSYGTEPDLKKWPLAAYPQPSFFTIVKKLPDPERADNTRSAWCLLRDASGKEFEAELGTGLHHAHEWATWIVAKHAEDTRQKNARIQQVESQVALLRSILIEQGVKVITTEKARALGINA